MADSIQLPGNVPKIFSTSKVVGVERQKLEHRRKKQKRNPNGLSRTDIRKETADPMRGEAPAPSQGSTPATGSRTPSAETAADRSGSRPKSVINIRI